MIFSSVAVSTMSQKEEEVSLISPVMAMKSRKVLKGHRGRVLHFDWSADKSHVVTAGQVRCVCVCVCIFTHVLLCI